MTVSRPALRGALRRWGRTRSVLAVVILVLAAAAAAAFVIDERDRAVDRGGEAAKDAAASVISRLLSYTPATVASDVSKEQKLLTGSFRAEYADLVNTVVAPAAVKDKVTVRATVPKAGTVSVERDQVVVLVFVNVSTQAAGSSTDAKVTGSRVRVTMRHVGDSWRMSGFDPL